MLLINCTQWKIASGCSYIDFKNITKLVCAGELFVI